MRQFLQEAGLREVVTQPTTLFGDNVQANRLCREHFVSTGNQYIYLPYHLSREAYKLGLIEVKWVGSKYNMADAFTKALTSQQLNGTRGMLPYILGYSQPTAFKAMLEATLDQDALVAFKRG